MAKEVKDITQSMEISENWEKIADVDENQIIDTEEFLDFVAKIDQQRQKGGETAFVGVSYLELRGTPIVREKEHDVYASYGGEIVGAIAVGGVLATMGVLGLRFYTSSAAKASIDAQIIQKMRASSKTYDQLANSSLNKTAEINIIKASEVEVFYND